MKIYYHPISFPALGALFAAEAIGLDYERVMVDMQNQEHKTPEYLQINLFGRVPAMVDGDFKLSEVNAMMRYMAKRENSPLYGGSTQDQAVIDQWSDFVIQHIRTPVGRVQFNRVVAPMIGAQVDKDSIELGLQFLANNLPLVEQRLSENAFLCGDAMTLADIHLVAALEPDKIAQLDLSPYPALEKWLATRRSEAFYTNVHTHFGAELGL